jgi:hypothetical protein
MHGHCTDILWCTVTVLIYCDARSLYWYTVMHGHYTDILWCTFTILMHGHYTDILWCTVTVLIYCDARSLYWYTVMHGHYTDILWCTVNKTLSLFVNICFSRGFRGFLNSPFQKNGGVSVFWSYHVQYVCTYLRTTRWKLCFGVWLAYVCRCLGYDGRDFIKFSEHLYWLTDMSWGSDVQMQTSGCDVGLCIISTVVDTGRESSDDLPTTGFGSPTIDFWSIYTFILFMLNIYVAIRVITYNVLECTWIY